MINSVSGEDRHIGGKRDVRNERHHGSLCVCVSPCWRYVLFMSVHHREPALANTSGKGPRVAALGAAVVATTATTPGEEACFRFRWEPVLRALTSAMPSYLLSPMPLLPLRAARAAVCRMPAPPSSYLYLSSPSRPPLSPAPNPARLQKHLRLWKLNCKALLTASLARGLLASILFRTSRRSRNGEHTRRRGLSHRRQCRLL